MTEVDEWRGYAKLLGFPLPQQAEKDYLQDVLLRSIYSAIGDETVLRGGTAISKLCSSGRFSEDLGFVLNSTCTAGKAKIIEKLEQGIRGAGSYFQVSYLEEPYKEMANYTVSIYGPLYLASRNDQAKQKVSINLNTYETNLAPARASCRAMGLSASMAPAFSLLRRMTRPGR